MEQLAKLGFHIPSLIAYLINFTILLTILYFVGYKRILAMLEPALGEDPGERGGGREGEAGVGAAAGGVGEAAG